MKAKIQTLKIRYLSSIIINLIQLYNKTNFPALIINYNFLPIKTRSGEKNLDSIAFRSIILFNLPHNRLI
jgi:hypothetical protein